MKKALLATIFLFPLLNFSQFSTPEIYGEFGVFYEEEFEPSPNTYVKVSGGVELFSYMFIAPEIDVSYYAGDDEDERSTFDDMLQINYRSLLSNDANAVIWGFAPKLFYGDKEYRLVFIPKWNFGKIKASGSFLDSEDVTIVQKASSRINFWSFSIGIEGEAWENAPNFGFYLTYNGFNAGKALNQLNFENQGYQKTNYNTKAIGLALRVSFHFNKKKTY